MHKRLLVIAGPNGSGKSTITNMIRTSPAWDDYFYISPDEVVKQPEYSGIANVKSRYEAAMTDSQKFRNQIIDVGGNLVFETVFSTTEKMDFLLMAKSLGYEINVIFVTTRDPQINIQRVAQRVHEGGHHVPTDKIISRYTKSMLYLYPIFEVTDYMSVYDNSGTAPLPVFYKEPKNCFYLNADDSFEWLKMSLSSRISEDQYDRYYWTSLPRISTTGFIHHPNSRTLGLMNFDKV